MTVIDCPEIPDRSMLSKSRVEPELAQVVTTVPSTETSTVLTLVSPLYKADNRRGQGEIVGISGGALSRFPSNAADNKKRSRNIARGIVRSGVPVYSPVNEELTFASTRFVGRRHRRKHEQAIRTTIANCHESYLSEAQPEQTQRQGRKRWRKPHHRRQGWERSSSGKLVRSRHPLSW